MHNKLFMAFKGNENANKSWMNFDDNENKKNDVVPTTHIHSQT